MNLTQESKNPKQEKNGASANEMARVGSPQVLHSNGITWVTINNKTTFYVREFFRKIFLTNDFAGNKKQLKIHIQNAFSKQLQRMFKGKCSDGLTFSQLNEFVFGMKKFKRIVNPNTKKTEIIDYVNLNILDQVKATLLAPRQIKFYYFKKKKNYSSSRSTDRKRIKKFLKIFFDFFKIHTKSSDPKLDLCTTIDEQKPLLQQLQKKLNKDKKKCQVACLSKKRKLSFEAEGNPHKKRKSLEKDAEDAKNEKPQESPNPEKDSDGDVIMRENSDNKNENSAKSNASSEILQPNNQQASTNLTRPQQKSSKDAISQVSMTSFSEESPNSIKCSEKNKSPENKTQASGNNDNSQQKNEATTSETHFARRFGQNCHSGRILCFKVNKKLKKRQKAFEKILGILLKNNFEDINVKKGLYEAAKNFEDGLLVSHFCNIYRREEERYLMDPAFWTDNMILGGLSSRTFKFLRSRCCPWANSKVFHSPIPLHFEKLTKNEYIPSMTIMPSYENVKKFQKKQQELLVSGVYSRKMIKNKICYYLKNLKETVHKFLQKCKDSGYLTSNEGIELIIGGMAPIKPILQREAKMGFFRSG